jgi:hypothetical protein
MVKYASDIGCLLSDLRLWKDDIKGAFGQFNMDPKACYLLATQIAIGVVMIYVAGMFGYHACPLIFGVFSRALGRVISASCSGIIYIYVDDIIGFAHHSVAASEQVFAQSCIRRTFGSASVAVDKSLNPCTSGEILGWTVDLSLGIIRPNDKAIRKLMWAFFMVDNKASKWPLQQCQMLASLAERYSLALRGMTHFVYPFHAMCGKYGLDPKASSNRQLWRAVSSQVKFSVEMWRMVAMSLYCDPLSLAMPIASLVRPLYSLPDYFLITDAGPLKLGYAIHNSEGVLLWYSSYTWPFVRNDNFLYLHHRNKRLFA